MSSHDAEHIVGTALLIVGGLTLAAIGGVVLAAVAVGVSRDIGARIRHHRRSAR